MSWRRTNGPEIVTVGGNWYWQHMTGLFYRAYTTESAERCAMYNGGRTCVKT